MEILEKIVELFKYFFLFIWKYVKIVWRWVFSHKKIVFIYIPGLIIVLTTIYVTIIYVIWQYDRDDALNRLSNYKKLIDRTEDLKKGMTYSYSDVDLSAKAVNLPTKIYDRNNQLIGEFFDEKRAIVPFQQIPQAIKNGVIASEDRVFYEHNGVNLKGIFRAFIKNVINLRVVQGGSTITQQLAKVLFTESERSLKRKIYEAFCALDIEKRYDKEDILSMYLNLIYFGNGAYGVQSAAQMFFGKDVQDCDEAECAMIVATISSPRRYSPLSNLQNSVRKTRRILKSMTDAGFIKIQRADYKYKKLLKTYDVQFDKKGRAVTSAIGSFIYSSYRVNRAPFFNEQIRRVLVEKFGESILKKGGLKIYTTIDALRQDVALQSLRNGIASQRLFHVKRSQKSRSSKRKKSELEKSKNIEGALVALEPLTGEIISYVGGSEFSSKNQHDHVSQILRQPGSSFKPILYTAAIEDKDVTAATIIEDKKTVFKSGGRNWIPKNYNKKYAGEIIVREALRKSINVVAVKVLEKTGYKKIFDYVQKGLNLSSREMKKRFKKTLSMALGTYELSPMENCRLHAMLVNGGDYIEPYGIRYVADYNGNVVWNNEEEVQQRIRDKRESYGKIIDPVAAAITVNMLKGVFEEGGTGYWAVKNRGIAFDIAGKTGTSTNYNDAWFAGYTSKLVTVVWIGNKRGAISLGAGRAGGSVSAPVWGQYIAHIFRNDPPPPFTMPTENITKEKICTLSGGVATDACPFVVEQYFYSTTEPGDYCQIHKKVLDESGANDSDIIDETAE